MPKSSAELKQHLRANNFMEEASKSRIIEAARAHILEDLKIDSVDAITFGLGFSLDVDW